MTLHWSHWQYMISVASIALVNLTLPVASCRLSTFQLELGGMFLRDSFQISLDKWYLHENDSPTSKFPKNTNFKKKHAVWPTHTKKLFIIESRLVVAKVDGVGRGMEWEVEVNICKLLYIEWINTKILLYSMGNYIHYPMINHSGKEFLFVFLGPHPQHMEVPRLGVISELHLLAYTTAIAMQNPSRICDYTTAQGDTRSPNRWARPGIELASSWILVTFISAAPQWELLSFNLSEL